MELGDDYKIIGMFASAIGAMWLFVKSAFAWMTKLIEKKEEDHREDRNRQHEEHKEELRCIVNTFKEDSQRRDEDSKLRQESINKAYKIAVGELQHINQNVTEIKTLAYKRDNHACYKELKLSHQKQ